MTFFIGVDLHKTQFTVHVRTEVKVESLDQIKQYPTTTAGYAEFLSRIETYKATGAAVKIGVESTGNTRFFKNQVEKAGAEVTVINTLKFKVINESTKKTDKHDASTISEFLSKDMLPESYLCGKKTENIRRLLKSRERLVRSTVGQKNEIHALLVSLGLSDELRSLQSKKGRQRVLDTLESNNDYVLEAQSVKLMFEIIERIEESVKIIEKQISELTKDDEMVSRLMTIRGCGKITAWTVRAYTSEWRMMQRYEYMKKNKGSGKSIVAAARKMAEIVWAMLNDKQDFDSAKMIGKYKPMILADEALTAMN